MTRESQPERRVNWMVNPEIQQSLSRRLLVHWCGTWLAIFAVPIVVRIATNKMPSPELASELVSDLWFPMMMSLLILPILVWDCVRFSHRVAGPISRISNNIKRLNAGERVEPIRLREIDFCKDLADDFNELVEKQFTDSQQADIQISEDESATIATC